MLAYMLSEALGDIENLQSYYKSQNNHVDEHVRKNIDRFRYGIAIDKFFMNQVVGDSDGLSLTVEEQDLVDKLIEEFSVEDKEDGKVIQYKLNPNEDYKGQVMEPELARKGYLKLVQQPRILRESMIMMLLIKYEGAISNIFHLLIAQYPQAYLSDRSVTYSEIISSDSDIEALRERMITKEVEEFMRMPISDWYKMLENKHNAKFFFENDDYDSFKEIYYRRNLIVHNQGIVNETYKNNVDNDIRMGIRLNVDSQYIKNAFMITRKILIGTFWGLRKISDSDSFHSFIFEYGYNCMKKGEWNIAEYVFSLLIKEEGKSNADRMVEQVNLWIAVKNGKGLDTIRSTIEELDVTAMNGQFVVAKYALLNEYDKVSKYLEMSIEKDIPAWCVGEWPLFLQYRETEQYRIFADKHKDILDKKGYESDNQSIDSSEEAFAIINEINADDNTAIGDNGDDCDRTD